VVTGELEAALEAQARQQGLTTDRLARRVLASVFTPGAEVEEDQVSIAPKTDGKRKARELTEWARSHRDTPPLSDEAISRAGMYPDRS